MTMQIKGTCDGGSHGKRFYMPGIVITDTCPKCGEPYKRDTGDYYLSYPTGGEPIKISGYCGECNHEWTMGYVVLKMSLEEVPEPNEEENAT